LNRRVMPIFFAITPVRMTCSFHFRGPHAVGMTN